MNKRYPIWHGYNDPKQPMIEKFNGMMKYLQSPLYEEMKLLVTEEACTKYIKRMLSEENN